MTIRKFVSLTVSVLFFAIACSRQGQGERCNISNGNNDCDSDLECEVPLGSVTICGVDFTNSQQEDCQPYRCCPPAGISASDSRCNGYGTLPPATGTGGSDAGADNTGGSESTGGNTSTPGT